MSNKLLVFFLFLFQFGYAQKEFYLLDSIDVSTYTESDNRFLDSCLTLYHAAVSDTDKVKAIGLISEGLMHNDWVRYNDFLGAELVKLLKTEASQAERDYFREVLAGVYNNQGVDAINAGEFEEATKLLLKSLDLDNSLGRENAVAYTLSNLGFVYENQGMIQKGLESYSQALTIVESLKDSMGLMVTLNNIGYIYDIQKEYDMALEQYQRTLDIAKMVGDKRIEANALNNIGSVYENINRLEEGITHCEKALQIRRTIGDMEGVGQSLNNIASQYEKLYLQRGSVDDSLLFRAEKYYEESLGIRQNIKDYKLMSYVYNGLSSVNFKLGNIQQALDFANKGLKLAMEMKTPATERNSCEGLAKIYKQKEDYKTALQYYERYILLRDSLINEENQKASIRQQTKYEFEKEELLKQQKLKEESRKLKEEKNRRNNLQYSLILIGVVVLFSSLFSLVKLKVSPLFAEGLIFFAFLIFFEFVLVLTDPFIDGITQGEPIYKLLANALLAGLIFPAHAFFERALKRRILKN